MSLIEWIPWMVYFIVVGALYAVHLHVERGRTMPPNNSTADRPLTPEEYETALRRIRALFKDYDDYVAKFKAYEERNAQVFGMTPYATLGVSPTATQDEIKSAYRRLRSLHHPDRGGDANKFQKIQAAYEQLTKPTRCPECEGKGTIRVKRGAFVDTAKCPRCWLDPNGSEK